MRASCGARRSASVVGVQRLREAPLDFQQHAEIGPAQRGHRIQRHGAPHVCDRRIEIAELRAHQAEPMMRGGGPGVVDAAARPARRRRRPARRRLAGTPPTSGAAARRAAPGRGRHAPGPRSRAPPAGRRDPGTGARTRRAPPPRGSAAAPPVRSAPMRAERQPTQQQRVHVRGIDGEEASADRLGGREARASSAATASASSMRREGRSVVRLTPPPTPGLLLAWVLRRSG